MEPTYTIEGNGDTIFILCDPDRPFEEVDHEDLWFNHLQQYDDITTDKSHLRDNVKDYRYRLQETRVNILPSARKNMGRQVSWRVSSEKLKNASVYFRDLATQDWNEGSEQGYKYTITVEGWNEAALHKLILRIHGQDAALNELQVNPKLCAQLAVIVDAYQCYDLFELSFPAVPGRYPYNENLLFSLFSSWVFRDEENFRVFSKAIITQARGRMHTLGMPIREPIIICMLELTRVLDAIEKRRQFYIAEMVNFANGKLQKLLACDQTAGDHLEDTLAFTFGEWPLKAPFEGFGAINVHRALDQIGSWDDVQLGGCQYQTDSSSEMDSSSEVDSSSEMDSSMTDSSLYPVTLKELKEDWEGLNVNALPIDV
ncbi:hypothetical protein TGAM01_v208757 [Trichoderma gamsii]|uniref:BTB domain-containing protein n=1 Tax=Trichoderma gamsii TaxID=398673 RepID=A0A2P4ZDB0_9HYPO|nr:hypothetical protein TGAM01_v208757 [Trichoderma gamsii]PON22274.1 hypothetical protein TGAM01_v208757 [Trichoderma gamsii]